MTNAEIQKQIDECLVAISNVRKGQSVKYGDRMVTRVDLDMLHRDLAMWERRLAGTRHSFVRFV